MTCPRLRSGDGRGTRGAGAAGADRVARRTPARRRTSCSPSCALLVREAEVVGAARARPRGAGGRRPLRRRAGRACNSPAVTDRALGRGAGRPARSAGPRRRAGPNLGNAAGSRTVGVHRIQLDPGEVSTPAHVHGADEEIFFVLGRLRPLLAGRRDVRGARRRLPRPPPARQGPHAARRRRRPRRPRVRPAAPPRRRVPPEGRDLLALADVGRGREGREPVRPRAGPRVARAVGAARSRSSTSTTSRATTAASRSGSARPPARSSRD